MKKKYNITKEKMGYSQKYIKKYIIRCASVIIFLIAVLCPIAEARAGSIFDFFRRDKETTTSKKAEKKDERETVTKEEHLTLPQVYIVKEEDSLSGIAKKFYGEVTKWTLIYEANKAKIKDPNRIEPGVELTIPVPQKEKVEISQIKSIYQQAKENFSQGDYPAAIVKFSEVIELEKDLYPVYTVYAQEYIQQAQEKIKEQEEKQIQLQKQADEERKRKQQEQAKRAEEERLRKEAEKREKLAQVESAYKEEPQVLEYTIGEEDVLYISVWQEENLSQEVIVRPDGKISFSLAGDVPAAGLTFNQLKEELTRRLKAYIKYPVISITLRKLGSKKVIVLGEVGRPGVYSVTGKRTTLEAVALAGGFTPHAVPSSVILIRGGFKSPEGRRLNLSRAIDKADMAQNVALQPEDIIYVPKKFIANVNYALSQILGPTSQGALTALYIEDLEE